ADRHVPGRRDAPFTPRRALAESRGAAADLRRRRDGDQLRAAAGTPVPPRRPVRHCRCRAAAALDRERHRLAEAEARLERSSADSERIRQALAVREAELDRLREDLRMEQNSCATLRDAFRAGASEAIRVLKSALESRYR
uniref:GTD-binding domain-containing protein n=1 Tax=Macrostomum lignano TaxID=282301 RepID=A0A1I8F4V3_9PLAT